MRCVCEVYEHFWQGSTSNRVYKAVYMLYDRITRCRPACVFDLPKIAHRLKECNSNMTQYTKWGKGKGHFILNEFYYPESYIMILSKL